MIGSNKSLARSSSHATRCCPSFSAASSRRAGNSADETFCVGLAADLDAAAAACVQLDQSSQLWTIVCWPHTVDIVRLKLALEHIPRAFPLLLTRLLREHQSLSAYAVPHCYAAATDRGVVNPGSGRAAPMVARFVWLPPREMARAAAAPRAAPGPEARRPALPAPRPSHRQHHDRNQGCQHRAQLCPHA